MTDVIAIIPARSGSKTLEDKNIADLEGHPVLAYSIAVAKLSSKIDRVIVSTNSHEYADIAMLYGAEIPFIRPDEYSTDTSTDRDFLLHAMRYLIDEENTLPEYWVHLRPTTPLRNPQIVDDAINMIINEEESTSLRSAHKAPESPFKWFRLEQKFFKPLIEDTKNVDTFNLPKESFDDVYIPDGYVDVLRSSQVLGSNSLFGERMLGFQSPVCIELDSKEEYELLKYQASRKENQIKDYLDNMRLGRG